MIQFKDFSKADYRKAGDEQYHKLNLSLYPVAIKDIKYISKLPRREKIDKLKK